MTRIGLTVPFNIVTSMLKLLHNYAGLCCDGVDGYKFSSLYINSYTTMMPKCSNRVGSSFENATFIL